MTMALKHNEFKLKLEKAIKIDNLRECKLKFSKENPLLDGFLADIYFAEVKGIDQDNNERTLKVFIKCAKDVDSFKGSFDSAAVYDRESFFYTILYPEFTEFLKEKSLNFDNVPKCLASVDIDNRRVIVLEDLKSQGYEMNDVHKPMSLDQMRVVFQAYARFHAISLAFKDQRPKKFQELTNNLDSLNFEGFMLEDHLREKYEKHNMKLYEMFEQMGEKTILEQWKKILEKGSLDILIETDDYEITDSVVAHADCWNNNMIFKYQTDVTDRIPSHVKLLDFQLVEMTSPVIDISSFFYFNCSTHTIAHFDELIEHYYQNLSSFIKQMGSEPDKLFPFKLLKQHWKNYSMSAAIRLWHLIHCVLCDKKDLQGFEDLNNMTDFIFKDDYKIKDMDAYKDRILAAVKHYLEYQEKYSDAGDN